LKAIGVIPVRLKSTRLKQKALIDICGRPLIWHTWKRANKAKLLDKLIVATDEKKILEIVNGFGGQAVLARGNYRSGTDRVADVVKKEPAKIVVNIQGDEPLLRPSMIDRLVKCLSENPTVPMATLMHRIDSNQELNNPNTVKVVVDREGFALYFSRSPIPYPRGSFSRAYKHIGIYAYTKNFLLKFARMPHSSLEKRESLEQLRALENGYKIKVIETGYDTIGVDTEEDLERVKKVIKFL